MTTTGTALDLSAPPGSVDTGRLVFTRGAAHLTIVVNGSMATSIGLASRGGCRTSGPTEAP